MSIQITANIGELSMKQKEALSQFILTFPPTQNDQACEDTPLPIIIAEEPKNPFVSSIADVAPSSIAREVTPEHTFAVLPNVESPNVQRQDLLVPIAVPNMANRAEVDSLGYPWDVRIHSETKAKVADGTWRKRRGCDPALVKQIEDQLQQVMSLPQPNVAVPQPNVAVPQPNVAVPQPNVAVPQPNVAVPQPNVAQGVPAQYADYIGMIGRTSAAIQAGKITPADTNAVVNNHGIPALPLLANRLDLVPVIAAELDALIASRS